MTPETLKAELIHDPFIPLRLHLVSGKTVDIPGPGVAWLMRNAVLVFQNVGPEKVEAEGYDLIALRNIERIEQLVDGGQQRLAG